MLELIRIVVGYSEGAGREVGIEELHWIEGVTDPASIK